MIIIQVTICLVLLGSFVSSQKVPEKPIDIVGCCIDTEPLVDQRDCMFLPSNRLVLEPCEVITPIEWFGTCRTCIPVPERTEPHFTTLDGVSYTFNGYGEYVLLDIPQMKFSAQVRTEPYVDPSGTVTGGTVFTAIAIKDKKYGRTQVSLNRAQKTIDIFRNGKLANAKIGKRNSLTLAGLKIQKLPNGIGLNLSKGIKIAVQWTPEIDSLSILVNVKKVRNTRGLLGNRDENPDNDFMLPDGTVLHLDPEDDREIFRQFGELWRISERDSLFVYTDGKSQASYNVKDYVPKFMSDGIVFKNKTLERLARDMCEDNEECLFDVSVTGQLSIGKIGLEIEELIEEMEEQARR